MKKLLSVFLFALVLILAACGNSEPEKETLEVEEPQEQEEVEKDEPVVEVVPVESEEQDKTQEDDSATNEEPVVEKDSSKELAGQIEKAVKDIAKEDFRKTEITEVRVNKDLSVDEERYIVLVNLRWDVKNKPKMTNEMLQQYSDHLAAKMADFELIYEFVEFWEVPYLKEGDVILKKTYENTGNGMFLKDEVNLIQ